MELYAIKEVSKKLKLNVSDTYKLTKAGHLQALKLGALKVTSLELERFIVKDYSNLDNIKELNL